MRTIPFMKMSDKVCELFEHFVCIVKQIEDGEYCDSKKFEMMRLYEDQTRAELMKTARSVLSGILLDTVLNCYTVETQYKELFLKLVEKVIKRLDESTESDLIASNMHVEANRGSDEEELFVKFLDLKKKFDNLESENYTFKDEIEMKVAKIVEIEHLQNKIIVDNMKLNDEISRLKEDITDLQAEVHALNILKVVLDKLYDDIHEKTSIIEQQSISLSSLREEVMYLKASNSLQKIQEQNSEIECRSFSFGNSDVDFEDNILTLAYPSTDCLIGNLENIGEHFMTEPSTLSSTKKSLSSDLSKAWAIMSINELEPQSCENNDMLSRNLNSKGDSGCELHEARSMSVDDEITNAPHSSRHVCECDPSSVEGTESVHIEMQREDLRSRLEEVGKDIKDLEVSFTLKC